MAYRSAWALPVLLCTSIAQAQSGIDVYRQLARFDLSGARVRVSRLTLRRDRVSMTFSGAFYLEAPVAGQVRGAVFLGQGTFTAGPPSAFERDNLRRMLKADRVESSFTEAVLRFSDTTAAGLGAPAVAAPTPPAVQRVAAEFGPRLLRQTGANIAARIAISVLNREQPGFFCGVFHGGPLGRFTYILDRQGRLPTSIFGLDAGESGVIFQHGRIPATNDIWMAFRTPDDYARAQFRYSDTYDQIAVRHYDMQIDLRAARDDLPAKRRLPVVHAVAPGCQAWQRQDRDRSCLCARGENRLLAEARGEAILSATRS